MADHAGVAFLSAFIPVSRFVALDKIMVM